VVTAGVWRARNAMVQRDGQSRKRQKTPVGDVVHNVRRPALPDHKSLPTVREREKC